MIEKIIVPDMGRPMIEIWHKLNEIIDVVNALSKPSEPLVDVGKPIRTKERIVIDLCIVGDMKWSESVKFLQEYALSCLPKALTAPSPDYATGYGAAIEEMRKKIG